MLIIKRKEQPFYGCSFPEELVLFKRRTVSNLKMIRVNFHNYRLLYGPETFFTVILPSESDTLLISLSAMMN